VLVSYFSNLFLILINITGALKAIKSVAKKFFLFTSVGNCTAKLTYLCFKGASVLEENNNITRYLLSIPTSLYSLEV
jgi:hypothetical protein